MLLPFASVNGEVDRKVLADRLGLAEDAGVPCSLLQNFAGGYHGRGPHPLAIG